MKLSEYKIPDWKGKIQRKIQYDQNYILLLSIDRKVSPPKGGRKNLICVNKESNILWVAELTSPLYDSYYEIHCENEILYATSSNGFIAEINPVTGNMIRQYMFK